MESLVSYLETLLLYFQRNTELFLKKLVAKIIWFVLVFFTFCIGFAYLSFTIYSGLQVYLGIDPILSSFVTGSLFLLLSYVFLRFMISR